MGYPRSNKGDRVPHIPIEGGEIENVCRVLRSNNKRGFTGAKLVSKGCNQLALTYVMCCRWELKSAFLNGKETVCIDCVLLVASHNLYF